VLTRLKATRDSAAFRVAVAVMLGLWLGLMGLATFPQLHRLLNADSSAPAHDCLIAQLAKGQLLAAGGLVGIAIFAVSFYRLTLNSERLTLPASDLRLASPRGPPACSFLP